MQLRDDLTIFLFELFICELIIFTKIKPFVKIGRGWEDLWQQEVKEGPKLMQVILKWGTSQQESIFRI